MNVDDLDWLMKKVRDSVVGLGADWLYYATTNPKRPGDLPEVILCDDEVYRLEAAGLVTLEPDGPVTFTGKGRRLLEGEQRRRSAERKATREALRHDLFLSPDIQVAA